MTIAKVELRCKKCGKLYEVRHKCYNSRQAREWEEYMEGQDGLCRDCYHEKQNAESTEYAKQFDLVELEGSEKQIAWAEKIRADFIKQAMPHDPQPKFWELVNSKNSASFWIDVRFKSLSELVRMLQEA